LSVVDFPEPPKQPDLLIGPFTYHKVVVDGRAIPRLTGYPNGDDMTTLIVDARFAIDVPNNIASSVAWLVANALAVGEGYPHLGALTKDMPFAPTISQAGSEA
jgi:hypothetical protein